MYRSETARLACSTIFRELDLEYPKWQFCGAKCALAFNVFSGLNFCLGLANLRQPVRSDANGNLADDNDARRKDQKAQPPIATEPACPLQQFR
jgi:hypothetical protein